MLAEAAGAAVAINRRHSFCCLICRNVALRQLRGRRDRVVAFMAVVWPSSLPPFVPERRQLRWPFGVSKSQQILECRSFSQSESLIGCRKIDRPDFPVSTRLEGIRAVQSGARNPLLFFSCRKLSSRDLGRHIDLGCHAISRTSRQPLQPCRLRLRQVPSGPVPSHGGAPQCLLRSGLGAFQALLDHKVNKVAVQSQSNSYFLKKRKT